MEKLSLNTKTRSIKLEGDRIIYTLKVDGGLDYLTYNKELLNILKLVRLKPFRTNGRLMFGVREQGTDVRFYLYDLAYACYTGQVRFENFLQDIQKYLDKKSSQGLSIDHADSNIHNNTELNLSLMPITENNKKSDIVARIKEPAYITSVYMDGLYRVELQQIIQPEKTNEVLKRFGLNMSIGAECRSYLRFICDTPEKYVECLRWLTENHLECAEPLRDRHSWIKTDGECWHLKSINNSLAGQRLLSKMPVGLFQPFN